MTKLTPSNIENIKERLSRGEFARHLAAEYNCTTVTIWRTCGKRTPKNPPRDKLVGVRRGQIDLELMSMRQDGVSYKEISEKTGLSVARIKAQTREDRSIYELHRQIRLMRQKGTSKRDISLELNIGLPEINLVCNRLQMPDLRKPVPKVKGQREWSSEKRKQRIREQYAQGRSVKAIAKSSGVHPRTIYHFIKGT